MVEIVFVVFRIIYFDSWMWGMRASVVLSSDASDKSEADVSSSKGVLLVSALFASVVCMLL